MYILLSNSKVKHKAEKLGNVDDFVIYEGTDIIRVFKSLEEAKAYLYRFPNHSPYVRVVNISNYSGQG